MRTKPHAKDPWESRFEALLQADSYAQRIVARVIGKGVHRRRLILLLQGATDPNTGSRFHALVEDAWTRRKDLSADFVLSPPKQEAEHLVRSLQDTAAEIRRFWLRTLFAFLPYSKTALDTASLLDQQARALNKVKWKVITKRLGYKAFWRHLTLTLLCLELQVPDKSSYEELSQLTAVALRAWGRPDTDKSFSPDALRKRYERFFKRQIGRGNLVWLEVLLKMIHPSD